MTHKHFGHYILDIFKWSYKAVAGFGALVVGLFAVILVIGLWGAATTQKLPPRVPDGAVMVLAPEGQIVEQKALPDPYAELASPIPSGPPQTSVHSILKVIKAAEKDPRISGMALYTDEFWGASQSHLHDIADALADFRSANKPIYAISSRYSQASYMLAAEATEIFLNPVGDVFLTGFGTHSPYFSGLLSNLDASVNVFRVGTHKSAVEPFLRNDMSEPVREANLAFLNIMWDKYADRVSSARGLDRGSLDAMLDNAPSAFRAAGGDSAQFALQQNLVDHVTDKAGWRNHISEKHGTTPDGTSFNQIHWREYLAGLPNAKKNAHKIAVITAQGEIIAGEGPNTVTAAETTVRYIRDARQRDDVAAIVLRVNSPGGSAFASELIRQELAAAQADGKPVIASFASVAASGGYWISASADEIWASPSSITGSIGIFAVFPTFEKTLERAGIYTDGVSTSPLAEPFSPIRKLSEPMRDIIQQSVENGYEDFITLVAENRDMTAEEVDAIAQGKIWDGKTAQTIGLVDHLGGLDMAIKAAAARAEIDGYSVDFYREELSAFDRAILDLLNTRAIKAYLKPDMDLALTGPLAAEWNKLKDSLSLLARFNDPLGRYALCLDCQIQ